MRRIWPPEPEHERPLLVSDALPLRDWCVRFEVALADGRDAKRFASQYRTKFVRSAAVASADTAWVTFRTAAADENDAAMLAAITVKVVAGLKLVGVTPIAAKLHYADDLGEIFAPHETRLRTERQALLSYARALGGLRAPEVSADRSSAQGAGGLATPPQRSLRISGPA